MVVAKFLSSVSSFNGVSYNTRKVDKDKGELMKVENFGYLQGAPNLLPEEYKNYLKTYSSMNNSITDKQLHVTISAAGREYDKHQLTKMGEEWLRLMDYGNNPYMIIFHNDTDNNHVHLVSSRIKPDGNKVKDSFEHKRSLSAVGKILKSDIKYVTAELVKKAFHYNISTVSQFKLFFEQHGYIATEDSTNITLRKSDDIQEVISLNAVTDLIAQSRKDQNRINQLKAIFGKYKDKTDPKIRVVYEPSKYKDVKRPIGYTSDLSELLKVKLGIDIIFHGKKGQSPYGYTVIDPATKSIFKGGEIMALKELIDSGKSIHPPELIRPPRFIQVDGFKEKAASERQFNNSSTEIKFSTIPTQNLALISAMLKSALYEFNSIEEGLNKHRFEIFAHEERLFVLDPKSGFVLDASRVLNTVDYNLLVKHSGLRSLQKETEIIVASDNSKAYSLKGIIKNHGAGNYQFEKNGQPSYFIEILRPNGTLKTIWGIDLERAISHSTFLPGATVQLNYNGFKEVQIKTPIKDANGIITDYQDKIVKRNEWEITSPDENTVGEQLVGKIKAEDYTRGKDTINEYQESELLNAMQNLELSISDDVDDEQIHGPTRRRKKKARVNTR